MAKKSKASSQAIYYFFSHDFNARQDPKLIRLRMQHGLAGVGLFWCLVEILWEQGGYVALSEIDVIIFDLRVEKRLIESVLNDFALFEKDNDNFWSESVLKRIQERDKRRKTAQGNASERWKNDTKPMQDGSKSDANLLQTGSKADAINKYNKEENNKELINKEGTSGLNITSLIQSWLSELPNSSHVETIAINMGVKKEQVIASIKDFRKAVELTYRNHDLFLKHFKNWFNKTLSSETTAIYKPTKRNQI